MTGVGPALDEQAGVLAGRGDDATASATVEVGPRTIALLQRVADALEDIAGQAHRIANHLSPAPGDIVGTPYLAQKLGCSVVWAAEMARAGQIPRSCIVPGTGNGKAWKFRREQIEDWINKR